MKWLRDQSLTLALLTIFVLSLGGQVAAGFAAETHERAAHGLPASSFLTYLGGGRFLSALFENWESEFLQMGSFVLFTRYLYQRGSPESLDPDERKTDTKPTRTSPWAARQHGAIRHLYGHSLTAALGLLFVASFILHWWNSARAAADEARMHGEAVTPLLDYLHDAQFWFESFQNWQSEFLSTAVLVVLSIFLRDDHSPESKRIDDPHSKTGT